MSGPKTGNNVDLLRSINLVWYAVALVPIVLVFCLSLTGVLPIFGLVIAIFAFSFWLFSLIFALYNLLMGRGRPQ